MTTITPAISLHGVAKRYRFFQLEDISFELEQGQIMGLVGPNGAGKSTTIRILMGLLGQDGGEVRLLGHEMPREQAAAKRDVGYVSDDMRLVGQATLGWHMAFVRSIYPSWDDGYAEVLLDRFFLHPEQRIKGLSHGEHVKALLLLVLARRPHAGTMPFCALGLLIGSLTSGSAAPAYGNLFFLPMIWLSGLFIPLPAVLRPWVVIWPSFHLNQLAVAAGGLDDFVFISTQTAIGALVGMTVLAGGLAVRRLARVG